MWDEYGIWNSGFAIGAVTNERQTLTACGYDRHCYISTAALAPTPFTTLALIEARLGGLNKLIVACDDNVPPVNSFNDPTVQAVYNGVIQNVTTEIIGYLSPIYPTPLMQTGTVAILQVASLTTDGTNGVATLNILNPGNYQTAPAQAQSPVYLRHIDPQCNENYWGWNWEGCQTGTGLELTATYENVPVTDETGLQVNAAQLQSVEITAEGENYNCGDILVLTGGQSFVPAQVREAALVLICHSLYQRRLSPDEKNLFADLAAMWRKKLRALGEGSDDSQLDGTYKRFFSIGAMWGQNSLYHNASSL